MEPTAADRQPLRLGIIGGGRAAWAFGSSWLAAGWPLAGVTLRDASASNLPELLRAPRLPLEALAADSDLLLIAVSDGAIESVAATVPPTHSIVFHASGALASVRGGFSLHPLRSLPPVGEPSDLRETLLVFEGAHRELAQDIAQAFGARFAEVRSEDKTLYHAAAVFGSNYVAAMLEIAERLMRAAGLPNASDELVALAESALRNWREHEGPKRFTGPAIRGDAEVLARHERALADRPQLASLYRLIADEIAGSNLASDE